jgi:hypothetical protein
MPDSNVVKVIAFDPGDNTGWATGYVLDAQLHVIDYGWDTWKEISARYSKTMRDPEKRMDVVVYESFYLRKKNALQLVGSSFPVCQMVGVIKNEAWMTGTELVEQHPSDKPTIDTMMGGANTYLPKAEKEHSRDALRHLWFWAVTQGGVDLAQIGRKD